LYKKLAIRLCQLCVGKPYKRLKVQSSPFRRPWSWGKTCPFRWNRAEFRPTQVQS